MNAKKSPYIKWFFFIVLAGVFFFTLSYSDIVSTLHRGMDFFDSLLSGNGFNNYTYETSHYIPIHILFGVWCLPMLLLCKLGVLCADSVFVYLWAKALLIVALLTLIYSFRKLLDIVECDDKDFWTFALCTSSLLFLPTFSMGMYDILEISIGLYAVTKAAKEDALSWMTLVILSVAVSFKFLFIFAAIVIVLIKEKRILYLIRNMLVVMSFSAFFFLIFTVGKVGTLDGGGLVNNYYCYIADKVFPAMYDMPLFFIIFFITCFSAYFSKPGKGKEFVKSVCWHCALAYVGFSLFLSSAHPQWFLLLVPFLLIFLAENKLSATENILLLLLFELTITIVLAYKFDWVYLTNNNFSYLLLKDIQPLHLGGHEFADFRTLVSRLGLDWSINVLTAFSFSTAIFIFARNNPWKPAAPLGDGRSLPALKRWANVGKLVAYAGYFALDVAIAKVF